MEAILTHDSSLDCVVVMKKGVVFLEDALRKGFTQSRGVQHVLRFIHAV